MKQIRGKAAVAYAEENGIDFDIDEEFIARSEGAILGGPASLADVDRLFEERLGAPYDPGDILPGEKAFDFMVARYGDGWIYVPVEGADPEGEERAALGLFRRPLKEKTPRPGGDTMGLFLKYKPRLRRTDFPRAADLNLLFHAALRLSAKGLLLSLEDTVVGGGVESYGNRRFFVPPDAEVALEGVLCAGCLEGRGRPTLSLHVECARRLRKAVAGMTRRREPGPGEDEA